MARDADVLIVGAGLSGLAAARALRDHGVSTIVLDKGRGVGGRMATRRLSEGAIADHGAQFFTARDPRFSTLVEQWLRAGEASEWSRGFDEPFDGHPRYRGVRSMNALAKQLATGLDVRLQVRVQRVHRRAGRGRVAAKVLLETCVAKVLRGVVLEQRGVVDHRIELAPARENLGRQRLHGRFVGQVGFEDRAVLPRTLAAAGNGGLGVLARAAAVHRHPPALGGQRPGDFTAQTARGPGHQHGAGGGGGLDGSVHGVVDWGTIGG